MAKDQEVPGKDTPPSFDAVVADASEGSIHRAGSREPVRDPSRRAALIFGTVTAAGTVLGVLGVLVLAILGHPYRSAFLLGTGMILMGLLRAVWPGRPWFASRQKWIDVIAFVAVGGAVLYFAPWTATMAAV